jgi:hypothetical protein
MRGYTIDGARSDILTPKIDGNHIRISTEPGNNLLTTYR